MTEICFANAKLMSLRYIMKINFKKDFFGLRDLIQRKVIICYVLSTANMQGHIWQTVSVWECLLKHYRYTVQ